FDEGPHTIGEKAVIDLVDVREVVNRPTLSILVVNADFIVQDSVKAHVFEPCDPLHIAKVLPVAIAQAQGGTTGAEHRLPEMGEQVSLGRGINRDSSSTGACLCGCGTGGDQCYENCESRESRSGDPVDLSSIHRMV